VSDLVAALLFVAEDLDRRSYPFAGAVRQGARRITELEGLHTSNGSDCERCGAPLNQPRTGRPRKWCSESCRRKVTETPSLSKVSRKEGA
jgi:hypothetical protein